ncbi:MAG: aspartyl protease family protein [Acidobacteriota bacterium]|nr:aspartyl protease family protein [Acidobacteriota bacterium]
MRNKILGALLAHALAALALLSPPAQAQTRAAGRRQAHAQARPAVRNVRFASGNSATGIPFDFEDNAVFLEVRVNNSRPLKFGFDTGAGLTILNARTAKELGLKASETTLNGNAVGGRVSGDVFKGVTLGVRGATVSNQMVGALSFESFPCEARSIDGIIGYDFIKEFVVEIDYSRRVINLYDPKSFNYRGAGQLVPLRIVRTPFIDAKLLIEGHAPVVGSFEVDTGSDSAVSLNSPFVKKNRLLSAIRSTVETPEDEELGGKSRSFVGRVKGFQVGKFVLENPVVLLSEDTEGAMADEGNAGPIGNQVFSRFKVTIDYSRSRMYLEPNEFFGNPFEYDMTGFDLWQEGAGCKVYKVGRVLKESAGASAGLQEGDILLAVDGHAVEQLKSSSELYPFFAREGTEHTLTVRRGEQVLQLKLKLRRVI